MNGGRELRILLSFATHVEWHEGHAIARALVRLGHGAVEALVRVAAREPLLSPRRWISLGRAATTAWARRKA